jgi:hypothetical protein
MATQIGVLTCFHRPLQSLELPIIAMYFSSTFRMNWDSESGLFKLRIRSLDTA